MNKKQLLQIISVGLFLLIMYFFLGKVGTFLQSQDVKNFISDAGLFAPLIFSILYLLTMIFAPLTGLPFWITSVGLFGIFNTIVMVYLLSLIGAVINFYIARKFGRKVLVKLVGNNGLDKLDKLEKNFGDEGLIMARLFQGFIFEWISYAAGLTHINFKKYFLITAAASIPLNLLSLFIGLKTTNLGQLFVYITLANYILMTVPFIYFFAKKLYSKL